MEHSWRKIAVVTPLLKKDFRVTKNYLAAVSKVLEKIICEQVTNHMEANKLLPETNMVSKRKDLQ